MIGLLVRESGRKKLVLAQWLCAAALRQHLSYMAGRRRGAALLTLPPVATRQVGNCLNTPVVALAPSRNAARDPARTIFSESIRTDVVSFFG